MTRTMHLSGKNNFIRIKKGVKPYDGRVVKLAKDRGDSVIVDVGRVSRPQYEGSVSDERLYQKDEVEPFTLNRKKR